ncbi:MAG: oxidoreductase [Verrucomicrobiales bacterium]|nr:oxidoreductase [Verrucomicrobiales bacterium]
MIAGMVEMEPRVLVLFAHPALRKSRCNRRLLAAARSVAGVTVRDLYEEYSDFMIDVPREQDLLRAHDVIVFQHPFYWYSCPAILKEWMDLVLEHGFAYGETGRALHGKRLLSAVTTGGAAESYSGDGLNVYTVRQMLVPFEQTARLCGMRFLPPFLVQGTFTMKPDRLEEHAEDYARLLEALRDGNMDAEAVHSLPGIDGFQGGLVS